MAKTNWAELLQQYKDREAVGEAPADEHLMVSVDPTDLAGLDQLRKDADKYPTWMFGMNEEGEDVMISVTEEAVTVVTFQQNHWVRRNVYRPDCQEELFEGKW